jgi:two-component system chemotaxis response regulator CheV
MGYAIGCHVPIDPADGFVIETEYNRLVQGFLVHGVARIINKNWEEIKPPPKGLSNQNFLTAVTEVDGELVEIIDVEKILSDLMNLSAVVSSEVREDDAPACQGKHVFVADDSLVALKQVTRVLDQLNMTYTTARNGREALDKLMTMAEEMDGRISDHIHMVISDVEMPEMDGYTLTKLIKDDPNLKDLFVCLHTSLSGVFNQGMVQKVGADAFLSKFKPDELADLVKDTMEKIAASDTAAA